MKRFTEQLQKKANSIRLSAAESRDLRERVVSYMEYHPLPADLAKKPTTVGRADLAFNPGIKILQLNGWRVLQWAGATMGILLLTFSVAAEKAVPGDSLYAVKVRFNEEVRSTLARTPYEKVVWETERLNRRVAEARLLASEGRLTNEVEVEVANAVKHHSDNARREIEELKQTDREGAALASIELDSALDVQSTSLRNKEQVNAGAGQSTALIATALNDSKTVDAKESQEDVPSYARLIAHSEQETTRAYELLKSVRALATVAEQSDIQRRLEDIGRTITEGMGQSQMDDTIAREKLVDAIQRTQRLIVFMTNIDLRATMTVEDIVPVTLTIEERVFNTKKMAKETLILMSRVDEALKASTTTGVREKLAPAMAESRLSLEAGIIELNLPEADIVALEPIVKKAHALVIDAVALLNIDRNITDEELPIIIPEVSTSTASTTEFISADEVSTSTATSSVPAV